MLKFIEGKSVYLRPVLKADLDGEYLRWINDRINDGLTGHAIYPHTINELQAFHASKSADRRCVWLAIIEKSSDRHVGNIELSDIDLINKNAEYKILIDAKAQGKGYGVEASRLMLAHGFGVLNLHRIYLGVHQDNKAARGLYTKLGFKTEGTMRQHFLRNGKYKDILVMGMLAREFK